MLVNERVECIECGFVDLRMRVRVDEKQAVLPDAYTGGRSHFALSGGQQEHAQRLSEVQEYLINLSQKDHDIILMSAEGYTRTEIAKEIGLPEGTVGRRLLELRLKLAAEFREDNDG